MPHSSAAAPVNLALIGIAGYGQMHLRIMAEAAALGVAQVTSVVAIPGSTGERDFALVPAAARRYPSFEAWRDAEAGRFGLCFLPVPIHLHSALGVAALAAGGSVLVEKPLASSWHDLAQILQAQPAPGHFAAVGFQDLYLPEVQALQAALLAGRHGRVRRIRLMAQWQRSDVYYGRNQWAGRLSVPGGPVLDSPLNNALAHFLMLALFFAGETPGTAAVIVGGEAELYRARAIESFDTVFARFRTRADIEINCAISHSGTVNTNPRILIETDEASIEWNSWQNILIAPPGGGAGHVDTIPLPSPAKTRLGMLLQLCRRRQGEAEFICSPRLAAAHSACILDLHAGCGITDFPADLREPLALADGPSVMVRGLDEVLHQSFLTGQLPSELGVAWANAAAAFSAPHSARLAALP